MAGLFGAIFGSSSSSTSSAGGPVAGAARNGGASGAPMYSFARLQQLYERLSKFRESDLEKGSEAVVETVRQITEALLWGEAHDARFFDFFCEKTILADFVRVLSLAKAPKQVKLQLLQSLSMLLMNIKCQTSIYYLLSNNHINRLIETKLDFEDEDILGYYMTFIKSLAMRLDNETVKFFFLQHPKPHFPLYVESTRFFDNRDQMVRTAVRTITLQVYRVGDPLVRRFVLQHAAESYFSELAFYLRDLWLRMDVAAEGAQEQRQFVAIEREHELQVDLLIYLSDVFELGVGELTEVLADRLLNCAMLPVLLKGVVAINGDSAVGDGQTRILAPRVALFLIRQVFDILRVPCLLAPLASALLQPFVPAALAYVLPEGPSVGEASPAAHMQEDILPNWLREHFVACLESPEDEIFLLAAVVVHGCLRYVGETPLALGATLGPRKSSPLEVYLTLLHSLGRQPFQNLDILRAFDKILFDVLLDPIVLSSRQVKLEVWKAALAGVRGASSGLAERLQACRELGDAGDWIYDVFAEEWALHHAAMPEFLVFCADPQRLLPASVWVAPRGASSSSSFPALTAGGTQDAKGEARGAVRAFLWGQRLLGRFAAHAAGLEVSPEDGGGEASPVSVEPPQAFSEGETFDLGASPRIVCGVTSSKGKHTRYLLLDGFWFMLVQPDPSTSGWGTIKTLCPLWQVQSMVDRGDPRTLQIFMHNRADKHDSQVTLTFEDVSRCLAANEHVEKHRQQIRLELMEKLVVFVDICSETSSVQIPT